MPPLGWAILCLAFGVLLAVAEVFIPSGGILGLSAGACLVLSAILAFREGTSVGLLFLVTICVVLPLAVVVAFRFWPRTPMGKRLFLAKPSLEDVEADTEHERLLNSLRGRVGRTLTALRPSGLTDFDGKRIDTVTEGVMIDRGELVRVIDVQGNRVVVRRVEDGEATADSIDFATPIS